MDASRWAEFFFTGSAILPPMILAWDPGIAGLAFVALLLAGCVCAIADPGAPHRKGPRA